jgi:hypothetical protein
MMRPDAKSSLHTGANCFDKDGEDKVDPLSAEPFAFRVTKSGLVQISYLGKVVTTLAGRAAIRFVARTQNANAHACQLAMAKATGHFKHGNERLAKNAASTGSP